MKMTMVKHETPKSDVTPKRLDFFDRFLDDWPDVLRRPVFFWPERGLDPLRVEEFTEDGNLVIRAEMAGIDPEKDVQISIKGDTLHIGAERREEKEAKGRDYVRREMHYGSFHRDLPLPKGTSGNDVKASYKDGILEVCVLMPKPGVEAAKKIPVTKG